MFRYWDFSGDEFTNTHSHKLFTLEQVKRMDSVQPGSGEYIIYEG